MMLVGPVLPETGFHVTRQQVPLLSMDMAPGQGPHLDKWSGVWILATHPSFTASLVKCTTYTAALNVCFPPLLSHFVKPSIFKIT